jgi:hypothetical protein
MLRTIGTLVAVITLAMPTGIVAADDAVGRNSQASERKLKAQIRLTNRIARDQTPGHYIAGEQIPIGIRVTGLAADGDGKIDLISTAELVNAQGRTIVPLPRERIHFAPPLGGGEVNYGRGLVLPSDATGRHFIRVTIHDQISGERVTEELEIAIAERSTFGVINLRTALDAKGELVSDVIPVGRKVFVLFTVNGCNERDGRVQVDYEAVFEELGGNRLGFEPIRASATAEQSIYGSTGQVHVGLYIAADRSGEFVLRLKVKDVADGKETEQVIPILVVGLNAFSVEKTAKTPGDAKR